MNNDTRSHQEGNDRIKRLRYRANHRGIKEMDIILGGFADNYLQELNADDLDAFETLMNENDRDLLVWFTGEKPFPHDNLADIFTRIASSIGKKAS